MPKNLYILTHGKHNKGGNDAKNYDGNLSEDGRAAAKNIASFFRTMQACCKQCYCGPMIRHREMAEICAIPETTISVHDLLGNDELLFSSIDGDGSEFIERVSQFLDDCRQKEGDVLIVYSRVMPIAMRYLQGGGLKSFGPFRSFLEAYEDAMATKDASLPILAQAEITSWEI